MLKRIMACKEREDNVNKLLSSLGEGVEVIWDEDRNACHTLCRALGTDESVLFMEDDIELCKDFLEKAMKEINEHPDEFVMFYSCKQWEIDEAENKKNGIPYCRPFVYTQAFYMPAGVGKWLVEFLKDDWHANHCRYSIGINKYLVENNIPRYLVLPALVQHIGNTSLLEPNKIWWKMHQSKTYRYE